MKHLIKIFTVIFFITNNSCYGQQLMKTVNDAQKLKVNEQMFIEKPLKTLLKNINPEIKMVTATPSNNTKSRLGYFIFRFVDTKQYDSSRQKKKYPLQITVFVKEPFEWSIKDRQVIKKGLWAKEDIEKYGNLTVVGIRVFGEK